MISQNYAYNKFNDYDDYAYRCVKFLMNEDEDIWKLLKNNAPDALSKPALTYQEKASLIFNGEEDETLYRVFLDEGQPNAWLNETCMVRILPYAIYPNNRTIATLTMAFDVYSHYRINHLDNYKTRVDFMVGRILKIFNGKDIGGIGLLYFDAMQAKENRVYPSGQIPFKGKRITMSINQG